MKKNILIRMAVAPLAGCGIAAALLTSFDISAFGQAPDRTATPSPAPQAAAQAPQAPVSVAPDGDLYGYPYKGQVFDRFIATSYKEVAPAPKEGFYPWMQDAYDRSHVRLKGFDSVTDLDTLLTDVRAKNEAQTDPEQRSLHEKQTAAFLHKMIKKSIRHFSLDRGFEFADAVERGERQCFLQSTLLAGLMQRAGMNAGVVMVTKSDKGEESNNGHAVALLKLANGHDLLVDVSHKSPFIRQQGLMVSDAESDKYHFVAPLYAADGDQITGYAPLAKEGNGTTVSPDKVRALSVGFIESQFDYYRGERTPGGFFAKQKSPEGLANSEKFFTRSIQEDPRNPLPTYALGMVELRSNKQDTARAQIISAYHLYETYGYVPEGPQSALALVHAAPQAVSMR